MTDNVLIGDDGDAVIVDFGGGNIIGWADHDKCGTMAGEEQGPRKILNGSRRHTRCRYGSIVW